MDDDLHPFLAALAAGGAYEPPSRPQRTQNGAGRTLPLPAPGDPQAARYAVAALDREARGVADTPEGTRNDALNTAAFRIGQLVGCGWVDEAAAFDTLVDAGCEAGLSFAESERTVTSGLDAGQRAPRTGVELHPPATPAAYVLDPGADAGQAGFGGGQDSDESHAMASREDGGEPTTPDTPRPRQLVDGGSFIHQAATTVPALWGADDDVLWAAGEPTIITGPTGVGKTTLGTGLVAGRLGLIPEALGYPVVPGARKTLVLAMDRPRQIQRAMARLLAQYPEDVLNERLVVWQGPPPMDLGKHPHLLLQLAEMADADTVVIDSLKDAAINLSGEEAGQGLSRSMNYCVANGVEVLAYHHQTKRSGNAQGKPDTLADVYGSGWITAGVGSVILLWGSAGDLVIELSHLKQPAGVVGPLHIGHDHLAGRTFLYDSAPGTDLLELLASGPQTASTVASWLHGDGTDRAAVAKARRRLDKLVELGQAVRLDDGPTKGGCVNGRPGGATGIRYVIASSRKDDARVDARTLDLVHAEIGHPQVSADVRESENSTHDSTRTLDARDARNLKNPQVDADARSTHAETPASTHASLPPFKGGEGAGRTRAPRNPISLESHDMEVCARCHEPAERLIPAPGGRRWCPRCAYPTENPMTFDDQED